MKRLEKIKKAHDSMDKLMTNLRDFGAADSEPDWHYQDAIRNALKGVPFKSLTAREWELFSDMKGAKLAAVMMNAATRKITKLILAASIREVPEIRHWAINNLWRVDLT